MSKVFTSIVLWACVLTLGLAASAEVRVSRSAESSRIENNALKLALSADGCWLLSFSCGGQGFVEVPSPLYEILLVTKDGKTVPVISSDSTASEATVGHEGESLTVTVTASGPAFTWPRTILRGT